MEYMKIDPKDFIHSPFWKCPKCSKEAFGVLSIYDHHYARRCRDCWHTVNIRLPKLNKRIIYLDQLAISEMLKAGEQLSKTHEGRAVAPFWGQALQKLHRLCRLQLIACPDSHFHYDESAVSPFFKGLKNLYESFSQGVSFHDSTILQDRQVTECARFWIRKQESPEFIFDPKDAVHGSLDAWQDIMRISMNINPKEEQIQELRHWRDEASEQLKQVFTRWQSETGRNFQEWFQEESAGYGKRVIKNFLLFCENSIAMRTGLRPLDAMAFMPGGDVTTFMAVGGVLGEEGIHDKGKQIEMCMSFFTSPVLAKIPFNNISSMLYAALARKAAAGQKAPPSRGMRIDVTMVSTLLPYCDAMFIDNECRGYLNEEPLRSDLKYKAAVFSINRSDDFLKYLDDIEKAASKDHLDKVTEVYGI